VKIRVIPTILTDGTTVVKGEKFNNWRTVGDAIAISNLYAKRDVDELIFLDVTARSKNSTISLSLMSHFSDVLDIPFGVGGGIKTVSQAKACFRSGAEKVILGSEAVMRPSIITEIADIFGSQAVVVAIDFVNDYESLIAIESGKSFQEIDVKSHIENLEKLGAGEILLQSCLRDGTLTGMDYVRITEVAGLTNLPVIASGGMSSPDDAVKAVRAGASAVAAGAVFQFTSLTPRKIREHLATNDIPVRTLAKI